MKGQRCSPEFSRGESWEQRVPRGAGTRLWAVLTLHCHLQHAALLPRLVGGHALVQPRAHLRQVLQQDLPGVRNVWKTGKIKWVYPLGKQTDQETSAVGSAQRPKLICGVKSTPERCKGRKKGERRGERWSIPPGAATAVGGVLEHHCHRHSDPRAPREGALHLLTLALGGRCSALSSSSLMRCQR